MNSIPPTGQVRGRKGELRNVLFGILTLRPLVRYAYLFVAGLILGILSYPAVFGTGAGQASVHPTDIYGTLKAMNTREGFQPVGKLDVDKDGIHGSVKMSRNKDLLLAEVDIQSQSKIEVSLQYDPTQMSFSAFCKLPGATGDYRSDVNIGKDYVKLSNLGQERYTLVFAGRSSGSQIVHVQVFSAGTVLYENELLTEEPAN